MFLKSFLSKIKKKSEQIIRKFIESFSVSNWSVLTDSGFKPIKSIHKTIPYQVWYIKTEFGKELFCADNHIVFDEDMNELFVKECKPYFTRIVTDDGIEYITDIKNLGYEETMYDIQVDSLDHRYYTNDILSHNTTISVGYALHYILFNDYKTVAFCANKQDTAIELLDRLKECYENLPKWLQQGIPDGGWNKKSIKLENGSKVIAASTSSSAIRGKSISLLVLDEFAHIQQNMAQKFYNSTLPTISSGEQTKIIIVSTPNGMNLFYTLWMEATKPPEEKTSKFAPFTIEWYDVPGRDEKWKEAMIAELGSPEAFDQEFSCCHAETYIYIRDTATKEIRKVTFKQACQLLVGA